ncbi:MAG: fumarylacetoacetate hydrolase [Mameliella sp.]|nr:fumarylacetoacetate hydrolase [Mameliella sp.]|tara:strand:+ start:2921 stop:3841 length:921 start_codon:yes stop_codon:yes gene_type:complete
MRFVTFNEGGRTRAGVLTGQADDDSAEQGEVLDLAHPDFADCLRGVAPDLLEMVSAGLDPIARRIAALGQPPASACLPLQTVQLLAPLPNPPRIVGAAHNYACALKERGVPAPKAPVLFEKSALTVIGPGATVILPEGAGGITYEAELAVVIGRRAKEITPQEAMEFVAGYTLFNDISASEIIRADGSFDRGKNFPTFGPMGPWLATPDEVNPSGGHRVTLEVDGVYRQDGTTADLLFGVAELISRLSHASALEPGTVIATGTPAGVAPVQTPPTWLEPGTVMTVAIEGLGQLVNPVENGRSVNVG